MSRRSLVLLLVVWVVFLTRGLFYSVFIPLWEGWDEYQHFAFVQHLGQGQGLPKPDELVSAEVSRSLRLVPLPWSLSDMPLPSMTHESFWTLPPAERVARVAELNAMPKELQWQPGMYAMYEGKQPPLYYVLASIVLRPFEGTTLVTREFVLRFFGVVLGSGVVFLSFICALHLFGDERTALQAAALITAMPQLFLDVARVSNEPMSILLFSVLTYCLVAAAGGKTSGILYAELVLGLGLLTKAYFVAAAPAVAVTAMVVLWREPQLTRLRLLMRMTLAGAAGLAFCLWWYIQVLSATGPVWADAAPAPIRSLPELFQKISSLNWIAALDFTLNTHVWLSGWSVLGIRSWIHHVFRWGFLIGLLGGLVFFLLSFRSSRPRVAETAVVAILYAGFWISDMYQMFVNFSKGFAPVSGGWYLLAAVIPEVLILITGYWQFVPLRWRSSVLTVAVGAFTLLEAYAIHFVSLPYYAGITRHTSSGGLVAFHVGDAASLGWNELMSRIAFNKPAGMGAGLCLCVWGAFLTVSMALPFIPRIFGSAKD